MKSLCVISCGKRKIWDRNPTAGPTKAREVYIGSFAAKCREYAERFHPESWCILSAKYGFLSPEDIIAGPYNVSFNKRQTNPISLQKLASQVGNKRLTGYRRVVVLGGRHYVKMAKILFSSAKIEEPLRDCSGIGFMMKKLDDISGCRQKAANS